MKFKINAGAEAEVLTQSELREELKAQTSALTGGCEYRWILQQSGTAAGAIQFVYQPQNGYVWNVECISVRKDGAGIIRVALTEDTPSGFITHIADDGSNGNTYTPNGKLIVPASTPLVILAPVYVGIAACRILVKEARTSEAWRL